MAGPRPLLIGHRGASGYRPEHTLAAYALAARMGADAIEPDLVMTSDGVLIARHEPELGGTTDVAARFASRRTTKELDGVARTGWFCEDFTLAELRTLRCHERLPELRPANVAFDGLETIPTFDEILALRVALSRELGRHVVVYPELKHPARSRELGLAVEERLVAVLRAHGLTTRAAPLFVQCFEREPLERVGAELQVLRVQLVAAGGLCKNSPHASPGAQPPPGELGEIAGYADAVGPAKELLLPREADGRSLPPTTFVDEAHEAGLLVHPWTFRAENAFLPSELRGGADPAVHGDLAAELRAVRDLGVDGLFCDHPDLARAALTGP